MDTYRIALLSLNVGFAPASVEAFAEHVEHYVRRSAEKGAKLLVLPEYAIEACLAFKPAGLAPVDEMAFLAECGETLVQLVQDWPRRYGVHLCLGSLPVHKGWRSFTNTAILLTSDGRDIRQDKLCLTPGEKDPDSWQLTPGNEIVVFELDGLKVAIVICLDIEMPAHSLLLAKADLDLVLVPSMTERLAGFHRVYDCAKARAVELMTSIAVCGVIGSSKGSTQNLTNFSGAALFVPCEEELGHRGVATFVDPTDGTDGHDIFIQASVPLGIVRQLRQGDAEVWPGAWNAEHVNIRTVF